MCPVMAFASRTYPTLQQTVMSAGSDGLHSLTGIAYPNGANGLFAWDSAARLARVTYSTNTGAFLDRVYTLSAAGDRTREGVNAGLLPTLSASVQRLAQDPADRLTAVYQKTLPDSPAWATNTPTWDANGNMLADGSGLTLLYDADNRVTNLQSAVVGTRSVFYNACGAAVKRVVNGTNIVDVFDGPRLLMSRTTNGTALVYYLWGNGLIAQIATNGVALYCHADGQGNVLALTGAGGQLTDQWFYSPYGAVLSRTGTTDIPFQWLGGHGVRSEGGGLYRTRYRIYHAGLMRFTAKDPLGLAGGVNSFGYAKGNPLRWIDPFGLFAGDYEGPAWTVPNQPVAPRDGAVLHAPTSAFENDHATTGNYGMPALNNAEAVRGNMNSDAIGWAFTVDAPLGLAVESISARFFLQATAEHATAYRAINPAYAESTAESGQFFQSGAAGRLGNDGVYANSTVEGAISEFQYHNPGVEPAVFRVQYPISPTLNVSPPAGYFDSALPFTGDANILTAPSIRAPGTVNLLIRAGATPAGRIQ